MADSQSRATIQTTIAGVISGTSGIEHVFTDALGIPRSPTTQDFIDNFREADTTDIQAWFLGRVATPSDTSEFGGRYNIPMRTQLWRTHRFQIEAYFSFIDQDSEPRFQLLIDAVLTAFNNTRTLGGFQATPIQLDNIAFAFLGDVYCHHAVLSIEVIEIVSGLAPA